MIFDRDEGDLDGLANVASEIKGPFDVFAGAVEVRVSGQSLQSRALLVPDFDLEQIEGAPSTVRAPD